MVRDADTMLMTIVSNTTASNKRGARIALALGLLLSLGGALFVWQHYFSTYHLATVQEGVLYRDGARSAHELEIAVRKTHAKTVVCLVDDQEMSDPAKPQFQEEMNWLKQQGIAAERIPVKLGGWPTTENVQRFLQTAGDRTKQPILVHCAQGVRRTAFMVAAYQESVLGYDRQRAKGAIMSFGHSDRTINDIRRFIDEYDPSSRTVSTQLAHATLTGAEK
jgi:protein tyrosine phosphatase (PTP) superfamily phosphohydrolase (DUF442 family)